MYPLGKSERKRLGQYLKARRLEKSISQNDIAKRLKLKSGQMISNIERGLCSPPLYQVRIMSQLYGISEQDLLLFLLEIQETSLRKAISGKASAA